MSEANLSEPVHATTGRSEQWRRNELCAIFCKPTANIVPFALFKQCLNAKLRAAFPKSPIANYAKEQLDWHDQVLAQWPEQATSLGLQSIVFKK